MKEQLDRALEELENIFGGRISTKLVDRISYSGDVWSYFLVKMGDIREITLPDAIIWPTNSGEIVELINVARRYKIPIIPFGGGAGVIGGTIPIKNGSIVVDLKKMNKVLDLDEVSMVAKVEAGIISQHLEDYLNRRGYMFPHYPMSMWTSTIGGFLATRASGVMSTKYGNMEDLTIGVEVVAGNGRVYSFPSFSKASNGPDLKKIFIGSEGLLGIFTNATIRIFDLPEERRFLVYSFEDFGKGIDSLRSIIQKGFKPAMMRLYDEMDTFATFIRKGIEVEGNILIIMLDEDPEINDVLEKKIDVIVKEKGGQKLDPEIGVKWWEKRFFKYLSTPDAMEMGITDTLETSVKWKNVKQLYKDFKETYEENEIAVMAHLSHFYQDSAVIYFTFIADYGERDIFENYRKAWELGAKICKKHEATISHHHGIGILKSKWIKEELGESFELLMELKKTFDPDNILNPGKLGLNGVEW